jgi:hypothetical protein
MKYLFLMYGQEAEWNDDERVACMVESLKICDELTARGKFLATSPLQPVATATTVRVRQGQMLITDGPFAETTEQLGGYFLLDLEDLDEAIAVAMRLPPATKGTVEIRPLLALEGAPASQRFIAGSVTPGLSPYLLLSYHNEAAFAGLDADALSAILADAVTQCVRIHENGQFLNSSPLHPVATATSVRVRDGKRFVTDGPFAETHEVLGGFYVILATSQQAAQAVAARQPGAKLGSMEVRPLFDFSALHNAISIS